MQGTFLQQLFVIGIYLGVGRAVFLGSLFSLFGDQVAESHDICAVDSLQRGQVLAVGDAAAANDTNPESRHIQFLLKFTAQRAVHICVQYTMKMMKMISLFSCFSGKNSTADFVAEELVDVHTAAGIEFFFDVKESFPFALR